MSLFLREVPRSGLSRLLMPIQPGGDGASDGSPTRTLSLEGSNACATPLTQTRRSYHSPPSDLREEVAKGLSVGPTSTTAR